MTWVGLPAQISGGKAALARSISQRCGVTVAAALLLTAAVPAVPVAVATLVSGAARLRVALCSSDWLCPGASGPQVPTVTSSDGSLGVPLSSTRVPEAAKKSPRLVTVYPYVTAELVLLHRSTGLALFAR